MVTCLANSGSFLVSSLWNRTFSKTRTCKNTWLSNPAVVNGCILN